MHTHTHASAHSRGAIHTTLGPYLGGRCVPGHRCHGCPCVSMCDPGSTWGLAIKIQPSSEVLSTDQRTVTSQKRGAPLTHDPLHSNSIWSALFCHGLRQCYSFRPEVLKKSLFIKTASCYCALWTTLQRLEGRGTKATNGWLKCDTTEKNRFDSVLMDNFSVGLHPMGAAILCSVFSQ